MAGLFANAQKIEAPKSKGRKAEVATVEVKGLERFAALKAASDSIAALMAVEEVEIKSAMADHFIETGRDIQRKPENFEGVEGNATASCQLKIRSSASVLSEDEQTLLTKNKIPFGEIVKQEEAFLINPRYTNDMALLALVEEALSKVKLPADFLMKQEKQVVKVATPDSIDAVFAKSKIDAETLLPVVTVLAIKAKIEGEFWGILDDIMNPEEAA